MIGLVGPEADVNAVKAAADETALPMIRGRPGAVLAADPTIVVAVGERAMIDLVEAGVDVPVLPVVAGPGFGSIDLATAVRSLHRLDTGDVRTRPHPIVGIHLGDEPAGVAVYDVMLVTSEPARISEYAVTANRPIDRFRADGVVVATPAGSHGYAATAGGPILSTTSTLVTVVPVAAFTTRTAHWVLDLPISLTVERDEGEISLLVDDRERRTVPNDRPVRIAVDRTLETVVLDG